MIGSGPCKFQEWRQGESVTLVRNDDYYGKVPYLDAYVIRIWPDQTAVVNALLNGEIDAAALEPADVADRQGDAGDRGRALSRPVASPSTSSTSTPR